MNRKYKPSAESIISISELMLPSHSNFSGKIHGGHILNLMDQIAFACASKHSRMYCVTASVNKVDFLAPVEIGELLTLKASVNYTGRTSMVIGVRVESENIQTGIIKHCNSSYFTMVAIDDQGNKAEVPGLILDNEEGVRRYARSITRLEEGRERKSAYSLEEFDLQKSVLLLTDHNMLLDKTVIKLLQ